MKGDLLFVFSSISKKSIVERMPIVGILFFFLNESPFVQVDGREKSIGIVKRMMNARKV